MTKNLKLFALFSLLWAVPYYWILDWSIADMSGRWPIFAVAGVAFMVGFSVVGYLLGRGDDESAVRYNLRHAYASASCLPVVFVGSLWVILFRPLASMALAVYLAIMAVVLIIGVIEYSCSIKGMSSKKLFK